MEKSNKKLLDEHEERIGISEFSEEVEQWKRKILPCDTQNAKEILVWLKNKTSENWRCELESLCIHITNFYEVSKWEAASNKERKTQIKK
jgi:hypothetical protein